MLELCKHYKHILKNINFIDLFSGIGGFRFAMEYFGANCVFSSEWDKAAQETYKLNFGETPHGDITKIDEHDIAAHNIMCAGFPCQSFSVSGLQKGFDDTRGTLFFDIIRIAKFHQPEVLLLENVKNLVKHDSGNTLKVMLKTLKEIGYTVFYKIINASLFGVPQRRERIYFVCFNTKKTSITDFHFPEGLDIAISVRDITDDIEHKEMYLSRNDIIMREQIKQTKDLYGNYPQRPIQIGKLNKGGQGERIYSLDGHAVTQAATTGGPGATTGLYYFDGNIRKLTPLESSRLQGFPDSFIPHPKKSYAYKQIGNSIAINVVQSIIKEIIDM